MEQIYIHYHGRPRPVTGKPIPHEQIFTDHARRGCYNSCAACSDDKRTLAERLADLNRAAISAAKGGAA